jgi:hypothetical protein
MDHAPVLRLTARRRSTTSRNVSLMRLCQPLPLPLKYSITSLSSRMVVCTLMGAFCGPRPFRGLGKSRSGKTSCARFARWNRARVHSGLSSSTLLMIKPSLAACCLPQADDPNTVAPNGKSERMETAPDHSDRVPSFFAIIEPLVRIDKSSRPIEILNCTECDVMLAQIGRSLGIIPFVLHIISLLQFILQETFS